MFLTLDDVDLHVRDGGPARVETPVLLLHGWPDTGDLWRQVTPRLAENGYRVIAPDLRGFGRSSRPAQVRAYSVRAHVGDVIGLLDALGIQRAHLVGHDWGGAIGWMAAALAPERVQTLTALSTGHPAALRAVGWRQWARSSYALLFQLRGVAERSVSANDFWALRSLARHPDVGSVRAWLHDPGALTASLNIYRASMRPQAMLGGTVTLRSISAPTLGIWSAGDPALTERQMTGSARYVTGPWRYERYEHCGHWIPLEAPEQLSGSLLRFLAAHS